MLHGTPVADPFRWLEDTESEEAQAWIGAQNARTRAVLDALPGRAELRDRLLALIQAGSAAAPAVAGDCLFHLERHGDMDQAVLVMRSAIDAAAPARVVVDPHNLSADHTAALDWFAPSPDGRLMAYGVSESGTERGTLRIVEIDTGRLLPDAIPNVRHPSVAWLPDGSAFAYSRLPDPADVGPDEAAYWERVWWHEIGDAPAADRLLLGEDLPRTALPMATISPDGRWLAIHVHLMPTRTDVILVDRETGARTVVVEGEEASTWCQIVGDRLYAVTNVGAPRGRVVSAPVSAPTVDDWQTIVPESQAVIEGAVVADGTLLVASTEHAVSRLHRYRLDGGNGEEVRLPGIGALAGLDADPAHERAFLAFTSFHQPAGLWRWAPSSGDDEPSVVPWVRFPPPPPPASGDGAKGGPADSIVVEQVFYPSTDDAQVPMFLVRASSTVPSPCTPTVLSGYGGFAIASTPAYSPGIIAFCEAGGVYALAGIRGGGEYGEEWHQGGMRHRKEQVFDDFAAAADWLVAEGRTGHDRLAIRGGSNGGLLVGAAVTRRPDLCRAAVCAVPLLDMLRYHRFRLGALWVDEYGDPDDPADFAVLARYSPYHQVADGVAYPALLVTTAESDSRVDPMHACKFVARLQTTPSGPQEDRPVLLRVETRAGHGQGKPAWKQAEEHADTWVFTRWQLGMI